MQSLRSSRTKFSFAIVGLAILIGPAAVFSSTGPETLTGQEAIAALKQRGIFGIVKKTLEAEQYEIQRDAAAYQATNPAHDLRARFTPQEASVVVSGSGYAGLRLECVGSQPLPEAQLAVNGNRIEYRRGAVTEWYVNDTRGLEQGFVVESAGDEPLTLTMTVTGDLFAVLSEDGHSILFRDECGWPIITYG